MMLLMIDPQQSAGQVGLEARAERRRMLEQQQQYQQHARAATSQTGEQFTHSNSTIPYQGPDEQRQEEQQEERVLQPLSPILQLPRVTLADVQYANAHVSWPQATYTLPEHDQDDDQVAYQLQVHYRVSYTLQLQQVAVGPPTADQPAEQLLASVPSAVSDSAWKDVLTLEEAPQQPQKVGSLRAGRFYAVRLRAHALADLDSGPVVFDDTYTTSEVLAFRTLPSTPGQMQAPSLARRDRNLLKLKWNLPDETGGEAITSYELKVKPVPAGYECQQPPDAEGFSLIYVGLGEGPEQAKDRTHFTLRPLGPGQRYSFRIRCFNPLGVGNWSLPSTFTTAPSVPAQPDPPQVVQATPESVTLSWSPPHDNGSAINFYTLEMDDGRGGDFARVHGGQGDQLSAAVTGLQSGLHYRVRLRAENGEGRSAWSTIQPLATAATLPSCPVALKLGQITRTAVSLSWSPPHEDGGSAVTGYEVQLLPISKIAVADLGNDWLTIYQGSGLSTNFTSLRAGCKYQLRVAAHNAVGFSQFSIPVAFHTAADAPLAPPKPTALIESKNLFIALQPPPHDGGSALAGFSIMLRCNAGAAAAAAVCPSSEPRPFMSPEWVEVFRGEYKGSAVPVLNLLPGTRYEFRAAACNAFGCSVYSEVGSAVTLPAEPLPPATPQLQSAAGHSLTVRWQEPYGHGSAVTKYKLSYACLGPVGGNSSAPPPAAAPASSLPEPGQRATDNGDDAGSVSSGSGAAAASVDKLRWETPYTGSDLSATVKQLQPAHRYLLRVRAINEIGASHWSQPLEASTAAAAPGQPVQLQAAAHSSSSSVEVSWQPPEVDNGAPVTAYHLEMQAAAGGGSGGGWTSIWQGNKLSHTVGSLLPGRRYSWRVRAANACGVGPWCDAVTGTTAPAVPGAPGKPTTSKVTATGARVKWGVPLEDNGAPTTKYYVQLRPLSAAARGSDSGGSSSSDGGSSEDSGQSAPWQAVFDGPGLETTVAKLQPDSSYEVRVAAENAVGIGRWSAAAEFTTPLRPPPPPTQLVAELDEAQPGSVVVCWQQAEAGDDCAPAISVYLEASVSSSKDAASKASVSKDAASKASVSSSKDAASKATVPVSKATVPVSEGSRVVLQGLRAGGTFSIKARSVGAGSTGHSDWSDAATVVLPAPPVAEEGERGGGGLAAADTAGAVKRAGKGARGGKGGAAAKAAAKGEADAQHKGGQAAVSEAAVVPKKLPRKKGTWLGERLRPLRKEWKKNPWITWALLAAFAVAVVVMYFQGKFAQPPAVMDVPDPSPAEALVVESVAEANAVGPDQRFYQGAPRDTLDPAFRLDPAYEVDRNVLQNLGRYLPRGQ